MWAANEANDFERTEGFFPEWLMAGLRKHGVCEETFMPYVPRNEAIPEPSDKAKSNGASRNRIRMEEIKHWKTRVGYTDRHIQQVRESLDLSEPVTATFRWAFGTPDQETYDNQYYYRDRNIRVDVGGHGVVIVGYTLDDAVPGGGYFLIRNSWGESFGDNGHVKITFEFAKRHGMDAYRVKVHHPGDQDRRTDESRP